MRPKWARELTDEIGVKFVVSSSSSSTPFHHVKITKRRIGLKPRPTLHRRFVLSFLSIFWTQNKNSSDWIRESKREIKESRITKNGLCFLKLWCGLVASHQSNWRSFLEGWRLKYLYPFNGCCFRRYSNVYYAKHAIKSLVLLYHFGEEACLLSK